MLKLFLRRYNTTVTVCFYIVALLLLLVDFGNGEAVYVRDKWKELFSTDFNSPDSLTYRRYKEIKDSIDGETSFKEKKLFLSAPRMQVGPLGVRTICECDTCTWRFWKSSSLPCDAKYYFELFDYYLSPEEARFIIDSGNYYLTFTNSDSPRKKISVRYVYYKDNDPHGNYYHGSVLIPVSSSTYNTLDTIFSILWFALPIPLILFIVGFGSRVFYRIALGKVFVRANVIALAVIGWILIICAILPSVTSYILNIIYSKSIPHSFQYDFLGNFLAKKFLLASGIIVLLLAKSFRHGYSLQQEQDLTV